MESLLEAGRVLRSQLASYGVATNAKPTVAVKSTSAATYAMFVAEKAVVQSFCKAGEVIVLSGD